MEFREKPLEDEYGVPIFGGRTFHQVINEIPVSIDNELYFNRIAPSNRASCISYYPFGNLFFVENKFVSNNYYEKLAAIPVLEKLKAIFKSFTITDHEGNIVLTLEQIQEENIVRGERSEKYYILQITDELNETVK
jgi:hypothetical protein